MVKKNHDFSNFSDLELGILQKEVRRFPEDKDYLNAILQELSKRGKAKGLENEISKMD